MTPAELLAIEQRHDDEDIRANDIDALIREVRRLQLRVSDLKLALGTDATGWFDRAMAAKAAALPPGHVAVPRELVERVCTPDKLAFRAIDELRALLEVPR